jgi:membrane protease YdiL (CAAX protease family)
LAIGRTNFSGGLSGWGLSGRNHPRRVLQAVAGYVAVCPLCFGLLALSGAVLHALGIEVRRHDTIAALQDPTLSPWLRTLIIFNAFVLAASVEELFFRGLLQPALVRFLGRTWMAVLVGGILFGLIHLQFLDTVAPLAAFGIVLGYLYAKTGSLTLVIFLHAIFNGKTLLWIVLGAS